MTPRWLTAFLDSAPDRVDAAAAFWASATGCRVSPARGDAGEFATLLPEEGDAHLRLQRLASGPSGIHLDLHVDDPRAAADEAVALGATEQADIGDHGYVVLRSPCGLAFCCVPAHDESRRAPAATWPGGHSSVVDQVCLDIPAPSYDEEVRFWATLTGWPDRATDLAEFRYLVRPPDQPLRLLLQRLGAEDRSETVRAHLDLATTDRPAEVARLVGLGARRVREGRSWTVLADPADRVFCVTDRSP
ncbi:MAG TPA: VOC family protein [Nocardioides sp.]|nr:VOC family protein [Nocardioides sp.]